MKTILFIALLTTASILLGQAPAASPGFTTPPPDMTMIQHILTEKNGSIDALMLQAEQLKSQVEQLKASVTSKDAELKKATEAKGSCE